MDFNNYQVKEFDQHAIDSYNAIHGTHFKVADITKRTIKDSNIVDKD